MAKEAVSPIERHLEKGVLLLTVLLLAGAVVSFLVSSPNTLKDGEKLVGPAEVYQLIADQARQLREQVRNHREKVDMPAPPDLEGDNRTVVALRSSRPFGPRVPRIKAEKVGNVALVSVGATNQPVALVGRSGMCLAPSDPISAMPDKPGEYYSKWNELNAADQSYVQPVNWVTVAAKFNIADQRKKADEAGYMPGRAVPYLVGAEVERRERNWDGTYTDWVAVNPYAPLVLPEPPELTLEDIDGKPNIPDAQYAELSKFSKYIRDEVYRLELMRPMPPPVSYGEFWLRPRMEEVLGADLRLMDDELLWGEQLPLSPYSDRYPVEPKPRPDLKDPKQAFDVVQAELDQMDLAMEMECFDWVIGKVDGLRKSGSTEYFTREQQAHMDDLYERAKSLKDKQDLEKAERERDGKPEPVREVSPEQVIWVHDTRAESVLSGMTYQYRMRALMYNNYAGAASELKDPVDAERVLLVGEWSPPSEDVVIPYDTKFYLVGKKERDASGKVDVFKWYQGSWLKASFSVRVGERVGGTENVRVGDTTPDRGTVRIDFSTGTTVVDLDFNRLYRRRKERRGVSELSEPKPTLSMVYIDSAGELYERLMDEDKRDEGYKEMKDLASR